MAPLRTHNLTKSYAGRTVVRGVSLDVSSGEIVGLLGPNGAGKNTTFYMTVGLTAPDSGRVVLDGQDITDDPMYLRARERVFMLVGGEVRGAKMTLALVVSPKFILLDEPFAGIDPIAVTDIQKIIFHLRDRGIGVLITDHNVRETLRITDRAYIVHGGVMFKSGTPATLAADEEVRRIYLGTEFRLD